MVWVEITPDVAKHKVAEDYPCVRIHFYVDNTHFHITKVETPQGKSIANYMPKDPEIADIIDKRLQAPNAIDAMYEMAQVFKKHGWELTRRR